MSSALPFRMGSHGHAASLVAITMPLTWTTQLSKLFDPARAAWKRVKAGAS
jgi:hypothetical protein